MIVNDELGRLWKEAVVAHYPTIFREGLGRITENLRTAGLRADILTRDLPNTKHSIKLFQRYVWCVAWRRWRRESHIIMRFII